MAKKKNKYTAAEYRQSFGKKGNRIVKKSEEMEQAEICLWIKDNYPEALYTVDLAGIKLTPYQKGVMKTRCKKGHPDLMFQEWFQDLYCGLAIEYKKLGTPLSMKKIEENDHLSNQWEYLQGLRSREYIAYFAVGPFNCKKIIKAYFEGTEKSLDIMNHYGFPKMKF